MNTAGWESYPRIQRIEEEFSDAERQMSVLPG